MYTFKNLTLTLLGFYLLIQSSTTIASDNYPPAIKMAQAKGVKIYGQFKTIAGLKGYAAEYENRGVTIYVTPDGKHLIMGYMMDSTGRDLSSEPLTELVYKKKNRAVWSALENTAWIPDGRTNAPRKVYVFSDPNCPYCTAFWKNARPWIDSGKVQLRHVMIGIIEKDSPGKAAALLSSKNPETALYDHENSGNSSNLKPLATIPVQAATSLEKNMTAANSLQIFTTPSGFYKDEDGNVAKFQGASLRKSDLEQIFGCLD